MKELPGFIFRFLQGALILLIPFQALLLFVSYLFCKLAKRLKPALFEQRELVIGVTETARMIYFLGLIFPSRYTVVLDRNRFYKDAYSYGPYRLIFRPFIGPLLLGYLSHCSSAFFYISFSGFCGDRRLDFWFLKKLNKKIVTLFCGSDIRSLKLSKEFFEKRNEDSYAHYLPNSHNEYYDRWVKRVAQDADSYADLILNWKYDQIGYIKRDTRPWPYIIDVDQFHYSFSLPKANEPLIVVHAPSSPIVKGTQLVRAAVKKALDEGYNIEYRELIGMPNTEIIRNLRESHIVLQEFYFICPGILTMEALACGNAVLCAASPELNPELPEDAASAWLPTRYWQVYDNFKILLDNPDKIEELARAGRRFVEDHYAVKKAAVRYKEMFLESGIIQGESRNAA